jgi:hypothetical protein
MYKRGKGLYVCQAGITEAYQLYLKKFNFKSPVSKFAGESDPKKIALTGKQYKDIWYSLADEIIHEIVDNSNTIKLPFHLGTMRIQKRKMNVGLLKQNNTLKIDYGYLNKTGIKRYHLNENRDNHSYKFQWLCLKGPVGKNLYSFNPLRINKRKLANVLLTTNKDYFE